MEAQGVDMRITVPCTINSKNIASTVVIMKMVAVRTTKTKRSQYLVRQKELLAIEPLKAKKED